MRHQTSSAASSQAWCFLYHTNSLLSFCAFSRISIISLMILISLFHLIIFVSTLSGIPGCAKSALCKEILNAPGGLGDNRPVHSLMGDLIKGLWIFIRLRFMMNIMQWYITVHDFKYIYWAGKYMSWLFLRMVLLYHVLNSWHTVLIR